jgi:hypothetical protein
LNRTVLKNWVGTLALVATPAAVAAVLVLGTVACDDSRAPKTDGLKNDESDRAQLRAREYLDDVDEVNEPANASKVGYPDGRRRDADGRWRKARSSPKGVLEGADDETDQLHKRLLALGYATGSQAPTGQGVSLYDEVRAFEGFNFYTSAHAEVAVLMDMRGNVLHEWRKSFSDVIEGPPPMGEGKARRWWRRSWLLENGDIIALNTGMGVMRLDKDSNVVWVNPLYAHHDLAFRDDGGYITLTRKVHVLPRIYPTRPVIEDMVSYLDARGEVERSFSILEAFERSPFMGAVSEVITKGLKRDLLHTNSIVILDGKLADRHPAFANGNLLLSFHALDAIGILDPKTETMVWLKKGSFVKQHDPKLLPNGNLLLFDNMGIRNHSRILELDPIEGGIVWQYVGSDQSPFYSASCGIAEVLPNGNTLITESDNGRAFEVTREGEIVWEFLSPHRAGNAGEFVATLPEVIRLPKSFPLSWMND